MSEKAHQIVTSQISIWSILTKKPKHIKVDNDDDAFVIQLQLRVLADLYLCRDHKNINETRLQNESKSLTVS